MSFYYSPVTPPSSYESFEPSDMFTYPAPNTGHSRTSSHTSIYSFDSSPDTVNTTMTTPVKSPVRQHGPLLLPKIRSQDQTLEPSPKPVKKTPLTCTNNPPGTYKPSHTRSRTSP